MPSMYELYNFYLTAEHLQGKTVTVSIEWAGPEEVYNTNARRKEAKIMLRFHGKRLGLLLNKTQCVAMMVLTGTDDYGRWKGHTVTLSPAMSPNGKQTIVIRGENAKAPEPAPAQPEGEPDAKEDHPFGDSN